MLTTLIMLLLVLWGGFLIHRSPRFPGSLPGGVLAATAAGLMVLFPLFYGVVKRVRWLKGRVSLGALLTWHVHTGAVGAALALLHTGHRFESLLGMALTTFMLLTALSGYAGRYLLRQIATDLSEKRRHLARLTAAYNRAVASVAGHGSAESPSVAGPDISDLWSKIGSRPAAHGLHAEQALELTRPIADLEHSIIAHERFKCLAAFWTGMHLILALTFYGLLGLHVWAAIYFGLRWFQ